MTSCAHSRSHGMPGESARSGGKAKTAYAQMPRQRRSARTGVRTGRARATRGSREGRTRRMRGAENESASEGANVHTDNEIARPGQSGAAQRASETLSYRRTVPCASVLPKCAMPVTGLSLLQRLRSFETCWHMGRGDGALGPSQCLGAKEVARSARRPRARGPVHAHSGARCPLVRWDKGVRTLRRPTADASVIPSYRRRAQ